MTADLSLSPFSAPYAPADESVAAALLAQADLSDAAEARIDSLATRLIKAAREQKFRIGGVEDLLREYSLSSEEGLALMTLAEALLRVPDDFTADLLIEDRLASAHWASHADGSEALLVSAAAWALGTTAKVMEKGKSAHGVVAALGRRIGMGALRAAARQAVQLMGAHFVFGETIEQTLRQAASREGRNWRFSFDMLGEGARTQVDADSYFSAYAHAIEAIGAQAAGDAAPGRLGISVKLSALHPRYEPQSRGRVLAELTPRVAELARAARRHGLIFTIDAEEADRLELSLDIVDLLLADRSLAGWHGFGLAVQAYQKRAAAAIDHVVATARLCDRRLTLRLVKGAYWDSEIKRAQERGLADYPVFTRKAMTDLNYLACARRLLAARDVIFPQFATHNALTVASIVEMAGDAGFEFQRLHGMGEELFEALRIERPTLSSRVYAPVGAHANLLAYLVRRLLENGANSSFVARLGDPHVAPRALLVRPQAVIGDASRARTARLPLPQDLHGPARKTAQGIEFGDRRAVDALTQAIGKAAALAEAAPIVSGRRREGVLRSLASPIDGATIGVVGETPVRILTEAMREARAGFRLWSQTPVEARASCLERVAQDLEGQAPKWLRLLQIEAGKTLDDAVGEWREAIDFCRYYAQEARRLFAASVVLPGPTGEDNRLSWRSRGVFACISPWNFPLSIFTGQVAAALAAGNSVLAKPAEQTPLIAAAIVAAFHRAGAPVEALHLLPGDGEIGAGLVALPALAGVAFTGSMETAVRINRALAAKDGAIATLIAETGGVNVMIADATALPEQVADDVLASSFRSAGQRCSALRLLCIQEDAADKIIAMIAGAARELLVGDPRDLSVHVGPVIDLAAKTSLEAHIAAMRRRAIVRYAGEIPTSAPRNGFYVAPHIFELAQPTDLDREVFGPILHVVRYKANELDRLLDQLEAMGYGLTLGVHSRIDATIAHIMERRLAGNCYVNRNMIGAVVGTQPFGGFGLSGTGPKAGGPHYLERFCVEQTVTINTAAVGGNAALVDAVE
ncbi:bifunctional proline dehydrogenase/L-glutamate gamma-semialdehyde dehydrogenase PutA [Methylocapsa acidiphila]|uniref:bifunctional proline dehydrogenase/L-glutamate gamma-semialdehyde dehydrogenase PutA n=1 Tax=Methylocapsa acidiphila TaxID=133552 RepID=UPI0004262AB5|nr:bifunctional proline dehydrogenase/L-glutamate gamma-semialdehyde dehydrogenase PutA [Methylocapsa acidiphila]